MIKISAPSQGFASGLMQGFQAGASVTPTPQELQQSKIQNQIMKAKLAQMQAMQPYTGQQAQANLAMQQYKLQHPSVMYSGPAQQLMAAQEAEQGGDTEQAQALRQALQTQQAERAGRGEYYSTRAQLAPWQALSQQVRTPAVMQMMQENPEWQKHLEGLNEDQKKEVFENMQNAYQYSLLPAQAKTNRIRALGADNTFDLLKDKYNELYETGINSGIKGAAQLTIGQLQSRIGKGSKYNTLMNQINQVQDTLAKQYMAVTGMPNTDQASKIAHNIVAQEIGRMTWPQLFANLGNLKNLLGIEQSVYYQNPIDQLGRMANTSQGLQAAQGGQQAPGQQVQGQQGLPSMGGSSGVSPPSQLPSIPSSPLVNEIPNFNSKKEAIEWYKNLSPEQKSHLQELKGEK